MKILIAMMFLAAGPAFAEQTNKSTSEQRSDLTTRYETPNTTITPGKSAPAGQTAPAGKVNGDNGAAVDTGSSSGR